MFTEMMMNHTNLFSPPSVSLRSVTAKVVLLQAAALIAKTALI
jgi:hypothetical protein